MKELFNRCPECDTPEPGHANYCEGFHSTTEPAYLRQCKYFDHNREQKRLAAMYEAKPEVYPIDRPRWRVWLGWQLVRIGCFLAHNIWLPQPAEMPGYGQGSDWIGYRNARGDWLNKKDRSSK